MSDNWIWFRNRVLPWFGFIVAAFLLGIAVRMAWPTDRPIHQITLTAGSSEGTRSMLARILADSSREIEFVLEESDGSADALKKVDSGEVGCALVQGGLDSAELQHVRRVASLHVEPLHLLVKSTIYGEVMEHLLALEGKTINLSVRGSGTHELAQDLLSFLHIDSTEFKETNFSYEQLTDPTFEDLPDAVFTVSSLPSPVAEFLINYRDYRLVPLPFAGSFQMHWFDVDGTSGVNRRRTSASTIPAFTYSIDPPRPTTSIPSFGTRLELVTHKSVSNATVASLCKAVYESEFKQVSGEAIDPTLILSDSTIPLHAGAEIYLERQQPVSTGRFIEVTEQLVGIVGAALGGLLFLWQWLKRVRERRRDREFVGCVQRVVEIENAALRFEQVPEMTVDDLEKMQNELGQIKTELIQRYRDGYLEGAEMLSAFLKHANDASELISRIVLHETKPKSEMAD